MTTQELITAMDAHDAEGERLQAEMTALGLDAKKIKAIRKAEAATKKAQATLAELMGEPVKAPETPSEAPSETADEPKTETAPETPADSKKGGK